MRIGSDPLELKKKGIDDSKFPSHKDKRDRKILCSNCGTELSKDDIFCANCGEARKFKLLLSKPIYSIPIIILSLLILAVIMTTSSTYVIYSKKHQSTSTGGGTSGHAFCFNARLGQEITLSYRLDENTTQTADIYVAKAEGYFGDYPDVVIGFWGVRFWREPSGSKKGTIPSYGEYCLVIKKYKSGYVSVDLELHASVLSGLEFIILLIFSSLFLFLYWKYFPKIVTRSIKERRLKAM